MSVSALDFSTNISTYAFGVDGLKTAAVLRMLADRIESKEVLLQSARVTGLATHEDYTLTSLRLTFAERLPEPRQAVALLGPESNFPYDIAPAT